MSRQTFIQGAMILLAAGVVNRLLGFVPRVMLPRIVGAEGVGLYQMGYPFLVLLITLITGGIPLAISKLVAEAESAKHHKRIRSILWLSLGFTVSLSTLVTIACLWAAPWISSRLLTDERVYYTLMFMSPTLIFVSASAVLRGYFQGLHNMIPSAISQTMETIARSVLMLFLAYYLLPYGLEFAAAGAMAGVLFGEIIGLLVLCLHYRQSRKSDLLAQHSGEKPVKTSLLSNVRSLLAISVPVTASKLVGSSSYFLESIMIVQSLAYAGIATQLATAQYGALNGMIIPLIMLPGALTYALSVSLVPSLSEAAAKNDLKTIHKRLHQSLKLALIAGAPFATMMFVLAEPLCHYLFNDRSIAPTLKMMAPAAIFIYCQGPLQAALQSLNKASTALLNTFIGAALKLVLIFLLAAQAGFGIKGAVMAIMINMVLVTILHAQSVARFFKFSFWKLEFTRVGLAVAVMGQASYLILKLHWSTLPFLHFLTAYLVGTLVYLLAIIWLKLIDKQDFIRVPWLGRKLEKWL